MKCQNPNCKREATVHLTEIKSGVRHEMHLCETCAGEKGLPGKPHFTISEILAGVAGQQAGQKSKKGKEPECPGCGITLGQFQSSGRFGCPQCYVSFRDDILPLVEKIHDASQHVGKVPQRVSLEVSLQKELRLLQLELKRTVKREDYEKAAALRDKIRKVEDQIKASETQAAEKAPRARKTSEKKGGAS